MQLLAFDRPDLVGSPETSWRGSAMCSLVRLVSHESRWIRSQSATTTGDTLHAGSSVDSRLQTSPLPSAFHAYRFGRRCWNAVSMNMLYALRYIMPISTIGFLAGCDTHYRLTISPFTRSTRVYRTQTRVRICFPTHLHESTFYSFAPLASSTRAECIAISCLCRPACSKVQHHSPACREMLPLM